MAVNTRATSTANDAIRFILDGEVSQVRGVDPNTTVLNYLRDVLRRTGAKEGCAEGDCGACTVVVAELDGDRVRYRAANACIQFLPTLDGKELITVESLKGPNGGLHPVQQAMVECHGSQCGFCTPGIVMSLFALYKSEREPSRRRIDDALAGNLCRCTGYRPIIAAAERMYEIGDGVADADRPAPGEREAYERLRSIRRAKALRLKGTGVNGGRRLYLAPTSVSELAALALRHKDAHILAGGTDIGLWVTKDHRDLDKIIYVGNVEELKRIEVTGTHIEVGAAVTLTDADDVIAEHFADFGELLRRFASPPIRNAATFGGNVATGSPIGDSMPALIALGATLVLRRGGKTREIPLDAFYPGYRENALAAGEFVERLRIPIERPRRRFAAYKVSKRFDQDISAVCGAYCLELEGQSVRDIRVCYGGMAATPKRARNCEKALLGRTWSEPAVAAAMAALDRDYAPIDDMRASKEYRRLVARNLLRRFYMETAAQPGATRVVDFDG